MKTISLIGLIIVLLVSCQQKQDQSKIELVRDDGKQAVNVLVEGKLFTSYFYTDKISNLKKPVLFPIIAADGANITRGFPLEPREGERVDHPHHVGCWLNYGDVNGIDFWGFSDATPKEQWERMGIIRHKSISPQMFFLADWNY